MKGFGLGKFPRIIFCTCFLFLLCGCGDDTTLHPISGNVTLGGKSYERLIVYFRPMGDEVTKYNMGVGETDAKGDLKMRSTAGDGLIQGTYRVCFTCMVSKGSKKTALLGEKSDDDPRVKMVELVPEEYGDPENSPVEFTVASGSGNEFVFDIPSK